MVALGRTAMTALEKIFVCSDVWSDYTCKIRIMQVMVFPVILYKAGLWRSRLGSEIDAFEFWYWKKKTPKNTMDSQENKRVDHWTN